MAGQVGFQRRADHARHFDGARAHVVDVGSVVVRRRQQCDGGAAVGVAGAVAHTLVVQVEAVHRLHLVVQRLQRARFRRRQHARIAVDVDALHVATLETRGAVGIEDGQEMQRGVRAQRLHLRIVRVFAEEAEQVRQHHRGRALVAVHLRPEQYLRPAFAPAHVAQRTVLHAAADFFHMETARALQQRRGHGPPVLSGEHTVVEPGSTQLGVVARLQGGQPGRRGRHRRGGRGRCVRIVGIPGDGGGRHHRQQQAQEEGRAHCRRHGGRTSAGSLHASAMSNPRARITPPA